MSQPHPAEKSLAEKSVPEEALGSVEIEFVAFFVHLAESLGLPRSVGQIFGCLFAAPGPLAFEEIVARLGISTGSASQGLKLLVKLGAVSQVFVPRDRRRFYEAEVRLRKLFASALEESVRPRLEGNLRAVSAIEALVEEEDRAGRLGELAEHYRYRAASLRGWNEKALQILPLLERLFSLPAPLLPFRFLSSGPGGEAAEAPHTDP
jgi:DNA-binding transcriptional regulator GbsR (MarR family)